jgi:hypothetical protein
VALNTINHSITQNRVHSTDGTLIFVNVPIGNKLKDFHWLYLIDNYQLLIKWHQYFNQQVLFLDELEMLNTCVDC